MGKPVKILDLANDLIKFSGLRPGQDIEVKFIKDCAQGEKLYEELLTAEEGLTKTSYEKIFVGAPQPLDRLELTSTLERLFKHAKNDDDSSIRVENLIEWWEASLLVDRAAKSQ